MLFMSRSQELSLPSSNKQRMAWFRVRSRSATRVGSPHGSRSCELCGFPGPRICQLALSFYLPLPCAAIRHPQAVLRYAPGSILDARAVHSQWIGVPERAAALAISSRRTLCRRAMAVSIGETPSVVGGRPVPTGPALVIVAAVISRARIATLSLDLPLACAAICHPQSVLRYAPRAIHDAGIVHKKRVCILKGAAALAVNGSRSRC